MARVSRILDDLLARGATDLHLGAGYPPLARVRGDLVALRDEPLARRDVEALIFEILNDDLLARFTGDLDLDFAWAHGDKARFRVNCFHKSTGVAAVFRALPSRISSLDEIGCPDVIRRTADRRAGLVLVTGPRGSGKSTTLAAMIDHVNRTRACHVLTIEDPVELTHAPIKAQITHREVGPDAGSFAAAIRSAGREDADVILIGELGGSETTKLALQLAGSGVLVLAALHTNGAAATIDRIVNAFSPEEQPQVRGMLAESLVAVLSQQLLRSASGSGRVAAYEVLLGSSALAAMIREGKTAQLGNLIQAGHAQGMQTMDQALERLVDRGAITHEDALARALDKESFQRAVSTRTPVTS